MLTSGITRGVSGSIRKALVLSIEMQLFLTAVGKNSLLIDPPAEANTKSTSSNESCVSSSTTTVSSLKDFRAPADRCEANNFSEDTGKLRSSSISSIAVPTAPVAPIRATRYSRLIIFSQRIQSV